MSETKLIAMIVLGSVPFLLVYWAIRGRVRDLQFSLFELLVLMLLFAPTIALVNVNEFAFIATEATCGLGVFVGKIIHGRHPAEQHEMKDLFLSILVGIVATAILVGPVMLVAWGNLAP